MNNLEILNKYTYKNEFIDLQERIFNTLYQDNNKIIPTIKCVGYLINSLKERGVLSEQDIDSMLLHSVDQVLDNES